MASAQPTLHELKSYTMLAISAVFVSVSAITVILRVYVRGWMIRSFGWDDWIMMVTWFLFAVTCSLLIKISRLEITPPGVADPDVVSTILTLVVSIFGLYILTTVVFKLSLAIFFLRVVNQRWQRQVIIGSVAIYTLFGLSWLFIAVFQCGSPSDYLKNEDAGKCLPFQTVLRPLNYIHGILNAVTDWIFAIIPIFVVRSAQMPKQAKITVCAILGVGVLGSVCSIVRLAYVDVIGVLLQDLLTSAPNFAIVSIVELGLGIIAACLATLRPLVSSLFDKARTGISRSSRSRTGTNSTPLGIDGSKGISGSYVTSDRHYDGLELKENCAVTVTRELQIFTDRSSNAGQAMEMHNLSSPRENQHRGNISPRENPLRSALRKPSQSSEESLLEGV